VVRWRQQRPQIFQIMGSGYRCTRFFQ
jgi:hypothetical protein